MGAGWGGEAWDVEGEAVGGRGYEPWGERSGIDSRARVGRPKAGQGGRERTADHQLMSRATQRARQCDDADEMHASMTD